MSKSFSEWIGSRRKTVMLPSGIEAEIRVPSTFKLAQLGPLPGIDSVADDSRSIFISRRYIEACLVRLGDEKDPVGRGLMDPDDFSIGDINELVDAAISLFPRRAESEDGIPLADTGSPLTTPESSTE